MMNNEVVVVTGGLGYLGAQFVKSIRKAGGLPIVTDIVEPNLVDSIEDYHFMDITAEESITSVIDAVSGKYGKIDVVVNNAYPRNKNYGQRLEQVSYESFCENVDLHLGGYFLVMKLFAEYFKRQHGGSVVNISSIYGVVPPRFEIYENTDMTMPVEYAAIKSAVNHLTKYFANYYKGENIRFNTLSLGGILASQPESFLTQYRKYSMNKGMLDPEDVTGALCFLLSKDAVYINGQNLIVDDGWSL